MSHEKLYRETIIEFLIARDGRRCWICGKKLRKNWRHYVRMESESVTIDHVKPSWGGGVNKMVNLKLAHLGCNTSRAKPGVRTAEGLKRIAECKKRYWKEARNGERPWPTGMGGNALGIKRSKATRRRISAAKKRWWSRQSSAKRSLMARNRWAVRRSRKGAVGSG